jgi:cytochrome c-type biogenesis protein CcmE
VDVSDTDPAAPPSPELDLTPRDIEPAPPRTRRRATGLIVGVVVVVGIVAVLWNGLSQATLFFYNVDEAVAQRSEIGDKRFRMQGNVVRGSVDRTATGVEFVLAFEGEQVAIRHNGEPPELFGPKIPVVLEGQFVGDEFQSDRILIRHDNTYDEENQERIKRAEDDAEQQADDTP